MKLGITICATEKYSYALNVQAVAVQKNIAEFKDRYGAVDVHVILVSNKREILNRVRLLYDSLFENTFHAIEMEIDDSKKSHKQGAQKNIAKMRTAAFNKAVFLNVDYCWSLDSDVLPKSNALSVSLDTIKFDNGYYGVAAVIYNSQGGGSFLCGRGTFRESILQDFYDDERDVSPKVFKRIKGYEEDIQKGTQKLKEIKKQCKEGDELLKRIQGITKKVFLWKKWLRQKAPLKDTNVYKLNARGWKRRGWFDFAYPAIGKGSIVPSDWCGFGCTFMNKKALNTIDFSGYDGRGTEDLFINYQRWYLNGIKIGAIPHSPADHIIRKKKKDGTFEYKHLFTYHEPEGEFVGHLRTEEKEFNDYVA